MSVIPNKLSITSPIGVNSDNVISGGNWATNTYTGSGEENDFAYVGVNLQVDESGTLFFDFSQDGTNWSSYPVAGFDIVSGINEVHTAWKGGRYMRPRFVGTGGRSFFRLKTYYSNLPLPLSAPLNQGIGSDQDASIVRSVGIGENPSGSYVNIPSDGLGFSTTTLLTNGQTFDSGVLDMSKYTQVQTDVLSDKNGTIVIEFSSEATGVDIVRTLSIPYVGGSGFKFFSAPAFTPFVRYQFTCDEVGQADFYFDTKFTTKSISGQILGMEDFIATGMVANLGRNVTVGTDPNGVFKNQNLDGVAFRTESPLGATGVYTSPVTSTEGYSQIETHLFSDVSGTLTGRWYNDESKTTLIRTFTRPYSGTEVGTVSYFSSPVFGPYVEYEYTNGATAQASFFIDLHNRIKAISGQVLGMTDFIPPGVVANLGRNVLVGQEADGNFQNVSVTPTTNDTGTFHNLNVVSGARPSQLEGRTEVEVIVDGITASTLEYTVTAGKTFYVTDMIFSVENTANALGIVKFRDGTTIAGAIKIPLFVEDPGAGSSAVKTYTHSFLEPLPFTTGIFVEENAGTLTISGIFSGYEE
jgi:hypothetical protein